MNNLENMLRECKSKDTKTKVISGTVCLILAVLFSYLASVSPKTTNNSNLVSIYCESTRSPAELDHAEESFCGKYKKLEPLINAFYVNQTGYPALGTQEFYVMVSSVFVMVLLILVFLCPLDIPSTLHLSENETFLFVWIRDLKKKGVLKSESEFDSWLTGFESRYSTRSIEVMKLNFKK